MSIPWYRASSYRARARALRLRADDASMRAQHEPNLPDWKRRMLRRDAARDLERAIELERIAGRA